MRRLIALALVVALTLAFTAPAAEARHGHVVVGIGTAVGLALVAPFIIVGSILSPLVNQPPVYAYPPPVVERPWCFSSRSMPRRPTRRRPMLRHRRRMRHGRWPCSRLPHLIRPRCSTRMGGTSSRGDGVRTAYQWVWIPNAPPPPPPPAAPPHSR